MSVVPLPLEMRAKSSRKASLVFGWVFLMACSVITVFSGGALALVGLFGLAFFGYAGLKLFRQRSDLAGLVLTPEGVRPLGWSAIIPWSEVTDIGVGRYSHNKLVGFNVADYDRLIARFSAQELRELEALKATSRPLSMAVGAAGEDPGALLELGKGNLKDTFAASRREVGWDVIAMQVYLDRPVEQAAALLEAARQQQIRQPPTTQ
jgi:hypothetical protein